jgi:predicted nucleotide-binding protein
MTAEAASNMESSGLPVRVTVEDISAICLYLAKKPTGATLKEARAVLDAKHLDIRKISALKRWNLIEDSGEKLRLSERGRVVVKDGGAHRAAALLSIIREIEPYCASVERAAHRKEFSSTSTDTAAHWHENFKGRVSGNDSRLNEQVMAFFQLAEGADLGRVVVGRRGQPTRFEFDPDAVARFVDGDVDDAVESKPPVRTTSIEESSTDSREDGLKLVPPGRASRRDDQMKAVTENRKVFVTHGKNKGLVPQLKELLTFGKLEPIVSVERESVSKPVPDKVMDDMRICGAAIIHVDADRELLTTEGDKEVVINSNVLIEIGAAMALYGRRFILLVQRGVRLPSNLQGLYEVRYDGEKLDGEATLRLLKAFNEFSST